MSIYSDPFIFRDRFKPERHFREFVSKAVPRTYKWVVPLLEHYAQPGSKRLRDIPKITLPGVPSFKKPRVATTAQLDLRKPSKTQLTTKTKEERSGPYPKMSGFYAKKFRTRRSGRVSVPAKAGCERFLEKGGTVTDPSSSAGSSQGSVYIGHGTAQRQVYYVVIGAILRKLAARAGIDIKSWTGRIQSTEDISPPSLIGGVVYIFLKRANDIDPVFSQSPVTADMSWTQLEDALYAGLLSLSGADFANLQFTEAHWTRNDPNIQLPAAKINLRGAHIKVGFTSNMKIQNQTLSEGVDTTDNVDANPIHGKVYEGFGNGFKLGFTELAGTANQKVIADGVNGLIQFNWTGISYMNDVYRRPPAKSGFLGCYKMGTSRLQPGQIRTGYISFSKDYSLDYIMSMLFRASNTLIGASLKLGKCQLYGFEKHIHQALSSSPISLSYEINQHYTAVLKLKRFGTLPQRLVLTS
ncbi:putative capsid protein [uncultured virus]|uniref:Putative capsid protein n=1 Tax=uncultured virus TaxID=340016 RepID=A0A1I9XGD1_9VIRU|nr:putative capsid protein [uncultured virus]